LAYRSSHGIDASDACVFFIYLSIGFSIDLSLQMQVISTSRTCNCILIVLDAIKPITHKRLIEKELEGFGIR
jgi:ribosome-interacting GTPase 1